VEVRVLSAALENRVQSGAGPIIAPTERRDLVAEFGLSFQFAYIQVESHVIRGESQMVLQSGKKMTIAEMQRMLPTAEVARRLKVSPMTVARWVRKGQLNAVRTPYNNHALLFDPKDIDDFEPPKPGKPAKRDMARSRIA
jgi:excisionase family DNA binding protein